MEVDFMEQRSIALADVLVSPSSYLLSWMVGEAKWALPPKGRVFVQPYIMPQVRRRPAHPHTRTPAIFCGHGGMIGWIEEYSAVMAA
eukprot:4951660-Pyramimonas_sp.AAC.1